MRLGLGHRGAHVGDDLGLVPAEFEFEDDDGIAFGGGRRHRLQPVEIRQLGLHRPDQQFLAVLGRDAGKGHADEQRGDLDIRLALFRQIRIGQRACQDRQDDEGDDHAGPGRGPVDDSRHFRASR